MKKLAFFLALFVGLNASTVSRKPEEEANEVIVAEDAVRHSTEAWIQRIAHKLKACYYGITKDGIIHELGHGLIHKLKNTQISKIQNINSQLEESNALHIYQKGKPVWIHYVHELENGFENYEIYL